MRRLLAIARLAAIFAVSLSIGVAGYLWLAPPSHPSSETVRAVAPPSVPTSAPSRPQSTATPDVARPRSTTTPSAVPSGDGRDRDDRLSRQKARALLERALDGKLADRRLQPRDYDRLTDAVLRLRSALRALRAGAGNASTRTLDKQRRIVSTAFAEIERITGVPPSDLGTVLESDDGTPSTP